MQVPGWYLIMRTAAQLIVGAGAMLSIMRRAGDLQSAVDVIALIAMTLLGVIAATMGIIGISLLVARGRGRPLPLGLTPERQEWLERGWWMVLVAILFLETIW